MDSCLALPTWVHSIPDAPFMMLQLQMLVVYFITQVLHRLFFKHFGMPPLVSQLFAGVILGPGLLGKVDAFQATVFPNGSQSVLQCLNMLIFMLSLFIIATKMDFTIIRRTGKKTIAIGLLSLVITCIVNALVLLIFWPTKGREADELKIASTMLPVTSHSVIVNLTTDIGIVNSELGRLALATALCLEIASIILTMMIINLLPVLGNGPKLIRAIVNSLGVLGLVLTVIFVMRPFQRLMVRDTPKDRPIKETYLLTLFMCMLTGALFTNLMGQFALLGAFIVGAGVLDGPPLGSALVEKFDTFISGILHPFFVTLCAMRADFSLTFMGNSLTNHLLILVFVSLSCKIIVCFVCGLYNRMSNRDALALAFLMCSKGYLELGNLIWFYDLGQIGSESLATLTLAVIVTATIVPLAVQKLYDPLRKYGGYMRRDIMHCKQNQGMGVVVCVMRTDNISAMTSLLSFANPTKEAPITAHILHLVKLAGRSQPVFISHDMQKKQVSRSSHSDDVIWAFDRFQQIYKDALSVHVFTALSPPSAMHDDICTLALDKVVSLIVLPYHRKFGIEGSIDLEDSDLRTLNNSVLFHSPCSVAILIDRGHFSPSSPRPTHSPPTSISILSTDTLLSVAVIFIGGNDDREALAFALRMNNGLGVRLTVIRLVALGEEAGFVNPVDLVLLKEIQEIRDECLKVNYMEMTVKDGAETALNLRAMIKDYNLMIVGRRFELDCPQTCGLKEWGEIKELGVLGDLLASPDLRCRTSVLVVQQQQRHRTR